MCTGTDGAPALFRLCWTAQTVTSRGQALSVGPHRKSALLESPAVLKIAQDCRADDATVSERRWRKHEDVQAATGRNRAKDLLLIKAGQHSRSDAVDGDAQSREANAATRAASVGFTPKPAGWRATLRQPEGGTMESSAHADSELPIFAPVVSAGPVFWAGKQHVCHYYTRQGRRPAGSE